MKYLRLLFVTLLLCAYLKGERRVVTVREEGVGAEEGEQPPPELRTESELLHWEMQQTLAALELERSQWPCPPFVKDARWRWQQLQFSKPAKD